MVIDPKTVDAFTDNRERFGANVLKLTGSGENSGDILMMELSKGLLGARGELVTPQRFISFRANGKLTRLKKSESFDCSTAGELETSSASAYSSWTFSADDGKYRIRFVNHTGPFFTIEKDYLKKGSALLWEILGKTLRDSILASRGLGDPGFHADQIAQKLSEFMEADVLVYDTMRDVGKTDPLIHWTGLQKAFAMLLAGSAVSGETRTVEFLRLFDHLDSVWADVLERFVQELERQGKGLRKSERSINSTSDMFDRLSGIWYLRTIMMLNFALKVRPDRKPASWKPSLLSPRAMNRSDRSIPELHPMPDPDKMLEEVENHRNRMKS